MTAADALDTAYRCAAYWWRRHGGWQDLSDYQSAAHEAVAQTFARHDPARGTLATLLIVRCASLMQDMARQYLGGNMRTQTAAHVSLLGAAGINMSWLEDAGFAMDVREPAPVVALHAWEATLTRCQRQHLCAYMETGTMAEAGARLGLTEARVSQVLKPVHASYLEAKL